MNWHKKTIESYNNSADKFKAYFAGYGSRLQDIERAIQLANAGTSSRVLEIGCGDGRDAADIIGRVEHYVGIDPSSGLLQLARKSSPAAEFVEADALSYAYPSKLNIVYAFASLLHVGKDDLAKVFSKAIVSLVSGGVFYISLKEADHYQECIKKDDKGERMFYLYTADDIKRLAGKDFTVVYEDHHVHGNTDWFTIALKKR